MKFKNQIILLIIISFVNIIKTDDALKAPVAGTDYPNITCGKNNPKKEQDCTKYGTDSDMLCCYVQKLNVKPFCTLLYYGKADEFKIDDKQTFNGTEKWSCGNKSVYLSNNIFKILILIFFINFIL